MERRLRPERRAAVCDRSSPRDSGGGLVSRSRPSRGARARDGARDSHSLHLPHVPLESAALLVALLVRLVRRIACLAQSVAEILAIARPRWRLAGGVLSGLFAGALASRLGWTLDDLWGSASAIDRQQVALGRWAEAALEPDARIGVNDTGAIAYLSNRRTFDVVGLTTPGEARYWVAGAGSRFEHYERLFKASPERLPTHFIVYRHWMACDPVLGDELHDETVTDQTILGGATMTAYRARYDEFGSGDRPGSPSSRKGL